MSNVETYRFTLELWINPWGNLINESPIYNVETYRYTLEFSINH